MNFWVCAPFTIDCFFPEDLLKALVLCQEHLFGGDFRGLGCLREIGLRYSECLSCLSVPMCVCEQVISHLLLAYPRIKASRPHGAGCQRVRHVESNPSAFKMKSQIWLAQMFPEHAVSERTLPSPLTRHRWLPWIYVRFSPCRSHWACHFFSVRHLSKTSVFFCPIFFNKTYCTSLLGWGWNGSSGKKDEELSLKSTLLGFVQGCFSTFIE